MKLVEILGKDNLAKLEKKLEQFIKYDPHLTQGINYNTVTFYSKETIPLDKFEHILDSITSALLNQFFCSDNLVCWSKQSL